MPYQLSYGFYKKKKKANCHPTLYSYEILEHKLHLKKEAESRDKGSVSCCNDETDHWSVWRALLPPAVTCNCNYPGLERENFQLQNIFVIKILSFKIVLPFALFSSTSVPICTGKQFAWKGSFSITLKVKAAHYVCRYSLYQHSLQSATFI